MVEKEIVWAECPNCARDTRATVEGAVRRPSTNALVPGADDYRLLECRGCGTIFYQHTITRTRFSPDGEAETSVRTVYFPRQLKRERPRWLGELLWWGDTILFDLLSSLYDAFDAGLNVLTAIGIRTAFDKATEVLGIDPSLRFDEKLDELLSLGHVGKSEYDVLKVLTEAGNAAAHRGWKPNDEQIRLMISVLESFIYRNVIGSGEMKELAAKVPAKPPRSPGSGANKTKSAK